MKLVLKPAAVSGKRQANVEPALPVADLVERVRDCYRRELRLRRVTRATKDATDVALLEAVYAKVEYERLVRAVVPPATDGDEIPRIRKLRQRIAARFRKRVERVTKRHASLHAERDRPLPNTTPEANDTVMQDQRRPLYIKETFFSESVLPADVRPVHDDDDEDDDEPVAQGPDLGDVEDDDEDDDEFEE
ncbi:MAG: hypothetical protein NT062_06890 [Proteobacteria bacterium]|nr:hypothetical protein [Pseudomonadota bacterium]